MFTKKDFGEPSIKTLVNDASSIVFCEDDTLDEMGAKFGTIDMICSCCPNAPDFVTRYTPAIEEKDGVRVVKYVAVSIRLRKYAMVDNDNFGEHRKFAWNKNIYADVIAFICSWIDNYSIVTKVRENATVLSEAVAPFCDGIKISFEYSDNPIVAIDNTSVTVGLSAEVLSDISSLSLFSDNVIISDIAKENCAKLFKTFISPIDIFRSRDKLIKDLGVTSKASIAKMIKKAYKKSITDVSIVNIPCRIEKNGYIGLVKRVPIDEIVEEDIVAYVDDKYGYIFVFNPVDKNDTPVTDIDKLESMVKEVVA